MGAFLRGTTPFARFAWSRWLLSLPLAHRRKRPGRVLHAGDRAHSGRRSDPRGDRFAMQCRSVHAQLIERAAMTAAPLPWQGYEKVFKRNITFNFRYDG
jgi:hypothetical protein